MDTDLQTHANYNMIKLFNQIILSKENNCIFLERRILYQHLLFLLEQLQSSIFTSLQNHSGFQISGFLTGRDGTRQDKFKATFHLYSYNTIHNGTVQTFTHMNQTTKKVKLYYTLLVQEIKINNIFCFMGSSKSFQEFQNNSLTSKTLKNAENSFNRDIFFKQFIFLEFLIL